jgi:hypothetical protein
MIIHSTIVEPHIRIRRSRLLPAAGTIVTGVGQKVTPNQTVARAHKNDRFHILPVADFLKIPAADVAALLDLEPGTRIQQGMRLLEKKRALGRGLVYESPVDGELFGVSNGRLIIRQTGDIVELRALLPGRVIKTIINRGVVIESFGALIQAVWSTPEETIGTIKVLTHTPDGFIFPEQLTPKLTGKIVAIGHVDQANLLEQAGDLGVRAVIAGAMPSDLFAAADKSGIQVMVTNGVGEHGFSDAIFALLKEKEDHSVILFPTNPETGRPEIIIPSEQKTTAEAAPATDSLAVGQQVRLLRRPYTNQMAEVVHVYQRAQLTAIGSRAYGADVRLDTNQVVFVPFANMEAIM